MQSSAEQVFETVEPSGSLTTSVVQFCQQLRTHGLDVSPACTLFALEAVTAIDIHKKDLFRQALALSLLKRPQDKALFYLLFDQFWRLEPDVAEDLEEDHDPSAAQKQAVDEQITEEVVDRILEGFSYEAFWQDDQNETDENEAQKDRDESDYSGFSNTDSALSAQELKRLVRALQNHFSSHNGRRLAPNKRGNLLDLRRSMRKSVRYGGTPIELSWLQRKPKRPKMILFVDVSRSMASYAKLLMQFAGSVLRHAWHVEVFLFASEIKRVSSTQLNDNDVDINAVIAECGGGTRIGDNLLACLDDYSQVLSGSQNVVMILSDGLDSGDDEQLEFAMSRLSPHARQLVWLNPMLGLQSFDHATREMATALPYIDVLAPAHNAACLWRLIELLKTDNSKGLGIGVTKKKSIKNR